MPERLPLDRALELERQVIADYLDSALLAADVDELLQPRTRLRDPIMSVRYGTGLRCVASSVV